MLSIYVRITQNRTQSIVEESTFKNKQDHKDCQRHIGL